MNMIFNCIVELFKNRHIQSIVVLFKIVSVVSLLLSVVSTFLLAIGYSFLHGYYFSGENPGFYSIIDIISNPIPFNFFSVAIISGLVTLSVVFLFSVLLMVKKRKVHLILGAFLFFIVFHSCLSIFFVKGSDLLERVLSFSVIWTLPIFITIMIFWSMRAPLRFGSSLSGTLYGLYIIAVVSIIFELSDTYMQLLVPVCSFTLGILFTLFKIEWYKNILVRFLVVFPYSMFATASCITLVEFMVDFSIGNLLKISIFVGISIISAVVIALKKWKQNKARDIDLAKSVFDDYLKNAAEVGKATMLATLTIVVVVLSIVSPQVSMIGGQYIRSLTTDGIRELQIIRDFDNKVSIMGNVVSIKEGIYYISNENWKLDIIKGDNIVVENNTKRFDRH